MPFGTPNIQRFFQGDSFVMNESPCQCASCQKEVAETVDGLTKLAKIDVRHEDEPALAFICMNCYRVWVKNNRPTNIEELSNLKSDVRRGYRKKTPREKFYTAALKLCESSEIPADEALAILAVMFKTKHKSEATLGDVQPEELTDEDIEVISVSSW